MKKLKNKMAILFAILLIITSLTGCVTGTIYGKPLDELSTTDQSKGMVYMGQIMDIMNDEGLDELNALGYHAGLEDAETFEDFWDDYQSLKGEYGKMLSYTLDESYQFGNEMVFVFSCEMEGGELMVSVMFDSSYNVVMMFIYETAEVALEKTVMPEGIIEEDIIIGEGTDYPVSGKLTYPADIGEADKLSAAVLVGGDGANTMDMKAGNTYLYRDLAWGLAEQGIVTIRYDKSTLTYSDEVTMEDAPAECFTTDWEYIDDALLATEMLRSLSFVDEDSVYYIGHSQGGVVAPRADEEGGNYAGLIMLSTSPREWYEVIYDQYINYGLVDQDSESIYYLVSKLDADKKFLEKKEYEDMDEDKLLENYILTRPAYFWKDFLSYDYTEAIKNIDKPVLILQGEANYQVETEVDFAQWQSELEGCDFATLKSYEGLNHLFTKSQGCFAGHYKEYDMPGRASQEVIDDIGSWILSGTISE